tara:strand:- start:131 stop:364 length:234 start_codon:yes stop_codon:yes gene_type:complete
MNFVDENKNNDDNVKHILNKLEAWYKKLKDNIEDDVQKYVDSEYKYKYLEDKKIKRAGAPNKNNTSMIKWRDSLRHY